MLLWITVLRLYNFNIVFSGCIILILILLTMNHLIGAPILQNYFMVIKACTYRYSTKCYCYCMAQCFSFMQACQCF